MKTPASLKRAGGSPRQAKSQKRPSSSRAASTPSFQEIIDNSEHVPLLPEHVLSLAEQATAFRFYSPMAHEVYLAGSFNNWHPEVHPMNKQPDGTWILELSLKPGRYEYRFVVDGQWADDPLAKGFSANPFGSLNSILRVE